MVRGAVSEIALRGAGHTVSHGCVTVIAFGGGGVKCLAAGVVTFSRLKFSSGVHIR